MDDVTRTDVLSWDWREQPDIDQPGRVLAGFGVHLHKVDTGTDEYAVVLADRQMDAAAVTEAYEARFDG